MWLRSCSIAEICPAESASQPCQEVPGGLWRRRARREASLPGSLSPSHGLPCPMSWGLENCNTCRVLCVGRSFSSRDHLTHLTSAGASGPSAHLVDLELGSVVGQ